MPVSSVTKSTYYVGLDVGKVRDPAAIAVMERRAVFTPGPFEPAGPDPGRCGVTTVTYLIRYLQRLKLLTPYPAVADRVAKISVQLRTPASPPNGGYDLANVVVDVTGVGRPVFDLLAERGLGAQVVGVNFTGGQNANFSGGGIYNVPKRDLVANLVLLFQRKQLLISDKLAEARVLVNELVNFQEVISAAGNASYGNDGVNAKNDDYVSAAALCAWRAKLRATRELGVGQPLL